MDQMMNIKELTEILSQYDENTEIILSVDSEGNSFSPVEAVESGFWNDLYSTYESDEPEDSLDDYFPVLCFWPAY